MTPLTTCFRVALLALAAGAAWAQPPRDTLRLPELQAAAGRADPRRRQLELQRVASELRQRNLNAERLPSLGVEGMAQYQSDVTSVPIRLPNVGVPTPPHDTYDARIVAQERLLDPTLSARRGVERATLAETEARVRTALYALRNEVNDAFFAAALMQARAGELAAVIADLEGQLRVAQARVREGTALPSESVTLQVELLMRRQDQEDLTTRRRSSLAALAMLTGRPVAPADTLVLPDLAAAVAANRDTVLRQRPELEQFARTRERLAEQERVLRAQRLPRLSAYGRTGYGKPGLDFLSNRFDSYWLAGLQLQWSPWTWGANRREREQR
jgi:outer membrane protein TolC